MNTLNSLSNKSGAEHVLHPNRAIHPTISLLFRTPGCETGKLLNRCRPNLAEERAVHRSGMLATNLYPSQETIWVQHWVQDWQVRRGGAAPKRHRINDMWILY
jgi:hypothetical protein